MEVYFSQTDENFLKICNYILDHYEKTPKDQYRVKGCEQRCRCERDLKIYVPATDWIRAMVQVGFDVKIPADPNDSRKYKFRCKWFNKEKRDWENYIKSFKEKS